MAPPKKRTVYKEQYAKDLESGIRYKNCWTIEQCCRYWGTTRTNYYRWKESIPAFKDACEKGDQDFYCACVEKGFKMIDGEVKGNAQVFGLLMSVLHGMNIRTDHVVHDEKIQTININVLQPKPIKEIPLVIEHDKE